MTPTPAKRRLRNGKRLALPITAAAAALAAALWFGPRPPHEKAVDGLQTQVQVVKQAASDENKVIQLSDGTHVWLNSSSKMAYPHDVYASDTRQALLHG